MLMRNKWWLGVLCLTLGCDFTSLTYPDALCLQHIAVVNPQTGIQDDQTVIIQAGKILRVADSKLLPLSPKNTIID